MKYLAIIPARSGSKGLKDKNIKLLNGKPLIAYTIEAALTTKIFEEVMVSTDSSYYAELSRQYGASVPFLRKEELAKDNTSSWDVVKQVLEDYKKMGIVFDKCVLLQPTSPLRTKDDITNAITLYQEKNAETVVSVCETEHPAQWCFTLEDGNSMINFSKSPYRNMRRQEIPKTYHEKGSIYIVDAKKIMEKDYDIYQNKCFAYIMSRKASMDIDNQEDFDRAEYYLK